MSSRALRRAQKELEEQKQLEQLRQEEEDDSEEEIAPASKPKPSLFAMLGDADGDDDDGEAIDQESDADPESSEEAKPVAVIPKSSKKSKKKKKKGKAKGKESESQKGLSSKSNADMDDIDRALIALNLTAQSETSRDGTEQTNAISEELQHLYAALAIDTQQLNAANEMRKLFGRAAVQTDDNDQGARQRGRGQQHGIAAATAGRNGPGRNLASLGLRRNIFIQGKEEWPRATSGGLGMEVVEKRSDGVVEYRFIHNTAYQSVQKEFETCVSSMDPDRMVRHLHYNPYHISTLLQVSEIAKQQRDNATSGELLERALFSFGRAVHSTFSGNLSQGKARLDFRRPENREFWLAGWRYIATLGVRATWRTAFEWAKLLLSLSPEEDPYCMRLLIDQLALRGRTPQSLVDLVESDHLQRSWKIPPNLAFSVALAHDTLKNAEKARSALRLAIKEYPWVASRLCRELEINPTPKTVWGKEPNDDHQELLCQLYVPKAKDLWNTTAATSLLVEVAYSFEEPLGPGADPYWLKPIDESNLARHVILSDDRSLLSLVDQRLKDKYTSVSDPLPPDDNISSYSVADNQVSLLTELERLRTYFNNVDLGNRIDLEDENTTSDDFVRALEEAGTNIQEFRQNTGRVQALRGRLQNLGVEVVFQGQEGRRHDSDTDSDV